MALRDTNQEYLYKFTANIYITLAPCSWEDFTDNVPKKKSFAFFLTAKGFFLWIYVNFNLNIK